MRAMNLPIVQMIQMSRAGEQIFLHVHGVTPVTSKSRVATHGAHIVALNDETLSLLPQPRCLLEVVISPASRLLQTS